MVFFAGTPYEMQRCPRRQVLDHPDVVPVAALRRDLGGRLTPEDRARLSSQAVAGLRVLDEALAWVESRRDDEVSQ